MLEALRITEKTFYKYIQLPLRENENFLDLEAAKDHYIVKNTRDSSDWSCVSKEHFDENYEFFVSEHPTQYRMVLAR